MKRAIPLITILSLLPIASGPAPFAAAFSYSEGDRDRLANQFGEEIEVLASEQMEGRGLETEGIRRAATWIEERLSSIGLEPAFSGGYRQTLRVKMGVVLGEGNELEGIDEEDWTPLGFSSPGEFSGDLVFAGYGIEAPSLGFQELEGLDLRGKIVLMLRYEPQERDEASPFDGKRPSRWSAMRYKVLQARERGASAVIFTTGPLQDEGEDRLPVLKNDGPESPAGIPVLQVRTSVAKKWLETAGMDLQRMQEEVDRDLRPRTLGHTGISMKGRVALEATYVETDNLAGVLPGRGDLASEYVVIGAHYDHLGMGGERSMKPNVAAVHNGADDNASGSVVALLSGQELARLLADAPSRRTVVIALFSGEEVGLAGSSWFVDHPPFPVESCVAMINLDMVGRLRDQTLVALGAESAEEWAAAIENAREAIPGLVITSRGDGYGPSDQTSFYAKGVPVLHLFTGAHEEYHSPEDKPGTLNRAGAADVAWFTVALGEKLALAGANPVYARASSAPAMNGDSRGYGAYLGTVPDYRAMEATEGGVLLGDVRPGGPADLAGIRGGDRIVAMAGTRIENLYDMTYALQDNKPGETIEVVVLRGEEKLSLLATLGDRAAMKAAAPSGGEEAAHPGVEKKEEAPAPAHADAAPARPSSESGDDEPRIDPFYQGRPGPEFVIGAGEPFERSFAGERHLAEIRQLTFGGENAEAYFSPDGSKLIYQATASRGGCDAQFVLDLATGESARVSSGKGRTTCGYFDWPEQDRIIYSSTEAGGDACPPPPDHSKGYVWALYKTYDIYEAGLDGSAAKRLTEAPGYDAEATWCHRGGKLVFTSDRDGDLDLYIMDEAGDTKRLTEEPGYDGGAFFSPDCSEIVWRASRPEGEALEDYRNLLAEGLIKPSALEIFLMDADGGNVRQLTSNGAANFCPAFTADGSAIIYSSNAGPSGVREFDLWLVGKEGGEPERITLAPGFDGFPQFSPDGRWLVWASNRADPGSRETNLFIARWVP